jgi:hypothetical protein
MNVGVAMEPKNCTLILLVALSIQTFFTSYIRAEDSIQVQLIESGVAHSEQHRFEKIDDNGSTLAVTAFDDRVEFRKNGNILKTIDKNSDMSYFSASASQKKKYFFINSAIDEDESVSVVNERGDEVWRAEGHPEGIFEISGIGVFVREGSKVGDQFLEFLGPDGFDKKIYPVKDLTATAQIRAFFEPGGKKCIVSISEPPTILIYSDKGEELQRVALQGTSLDWVLPSDAFSIASVSTDDGSKSLYCFNSNGQIQWKKVGYYATLYHSISSNGSCFVASNVENHDVTFFSSEQGNPLWSFAFPKTGTSEGSKGYEEIAQTFFSDRDRVVVVIAQIYSEKTTGTPGLISVGEHARIFDLSGHLLKEFTSAEPIQIDGTSDISFRTKNKIRRLVFIKSAGPDNEK